MDIKLGKINVNYDQIANSNSLKNEFISGFLINDEGGVTVISKRELTEPEIASLKVSLEALPAERQKSQKEQRLENLGKKQVLTLEEVTEVLKLHGLVKEAS